MEGGSDHGYLLTGTMKRPSKKEIKERIEKLKQPKDGGHDNTPMNVPKPSERKGQKGKIGRKKV